MLSAIGIEPSGKRRILGVSAAFSEAEVHWRAFLESLVGRGLQGVEFITSDDHPGLKAARQAVLPGARWQRCQFHLAQNAIHHAPNQAIRKAIGEELRAVWDAPSLEARNRSLSGSWPNIVPLRPNSPPGLKTTSLKDLPPLSCLGRISGPCALRTPSSAPSSKS